VKIVAFTGHRPTAEGMGGYGDTPGNKALFEKLYSVCKAAYEHNGTREFITGMALGTDSIAASAVLYLKLKYPDIKLVAAVPFKNQDCKWPKHSRDAYHNLLSQCDEIVYVDEILGYRLGNPGQYSAAKMQKRNEYMVDRAEGIIGVYNGAEKGGTYNCIYYAESIGKPVYIIDPTKLKF